MSRGAEGEANAEESSSYTTLGERDNRGLVRSGFVMNPVIVAEFRRWKARPLTYLLFSLLTLGILVYLHKTRTGGLFVTSVFENIDKLTALFNGVLGTDVIPELTPLLPAGGVGGGFIALRFIDNMCRLVLRPSTLIPVMMVWRAICTFRKDQMYRPLRTTFMTPGEFMFGVIAIPFLVSALIIMFYTGLFLAPRIIEGYFSMSPENRLEYTVHPLFTLSGILFEGCLNGAVICFVALYFGLRFNGRLTALVPVILFILLIQLISAMVFNLSSNFDDHVTMFLDGYRKFTEVMGWKFDPSLYDMTKWELIPNRYRAMFWVYGLSGTVKLVLCALLWQLSASHLKHREEG